MHGSGGLILVSGTGYGAPKKFDSKPKNHYMDNVRRMRQIQKQSKEREAESNKPVKALWKSDKYKDVTSKIKSDIQQSPRAPRPKSACFLRAHSRSGPSIQFASRPSTPEIQPPVEKLSIPSADTMKEVQLKRNDFDFIKINGVNSKRTKIPRSPSLTALDDLKKQQEEEFKKHKFGEVPSYLQKRQHQWKRDEEDRIANTPDPDMPPGHRVLPDNERRTTLSLLQQKEKDLTQQLASLPLRNDTYRIRSQKQELENKLGEIEEAKKIFSRSKVFVKIDQ